NEKALPMPPTLAARFCTLLTLFSDTGPFELMRRLGIEEAAVPSEPAAASVMAALLMRGRGFQGPGGPVGGVTAALALSGPGVGGVAGREGGGGEFVRLGGRRAEGAGHVGPEGDGRAGDGVLKEGAGPAAVDRAVDLQIGGGEGDDVAAAAAVGGLDADAGAA